MTLKIQLEHEPAAEAGSVPAGADQARPVSKTETLESAEQAGVPWDAVDAARWAREAVLAKKGMDVVVLDVRGQSSVTDFFVIASGSAPAHLKAMTNEVQRAFKEHGVMRCRRSGVPDDGWVVLDLYDVVIHILLRDLREYYAIEELWAEAPRLE